MANSAGDDKDEIGGCSAVNWLRLYKQVRVANCFNRRHFPKQLIVPGTEMRHRKIVIGTKVLGKVKYYCGNCAKELGKG